MERRILFLGAAAALVASGSSYFGGTRQSTAGPRAGYFPNVALRTHEDKGVLFYDQTADGLKQLSRHLDEFEVAARDRDTVSEMMPAAFNPPALRPL